VRRNTPADDLSAVSRLAPEPACQRLGSNGVGLVLDEVARRLKSLGPNLVTREHKPTFLQEIWRRAKNPLNALLLTLATLSYFLGDLRAALVIVIMVFLSVITAFVQEHPSNQAAARLRAMKSRSKRWSQAILCGCPPAIWFRPICVCLKPRICSLTSPR
jgi:Mg2+-importing ATPase